MKAYMSDKAKQHMKDPLVARKLVSQGHIARKTGIPQPVNIGNTIFYVKVVNFK